jgi:hypothetical protein
MRRRDARRDFEEKLLVPQWDAPLRLCIPTKLGFKHPARSWRRSRSPTNIQAASGRTRVMTVSSASDGPAGNAPARWALKAVSLAAFLGTL